MRSQNLVLSSLVHLLLPTLITSLPTLDSSPSSSSSSKSSLLPTHNVYQFPKSGTWLENLTMRPNSDILFTLFTPDQHGGQVYALNQPASPHGSKLFHLANITSIDAILGIERVITDQYLHYGNHDHDKEVYFTVGSKSAGLAKPIPGTHRGFTITLSNKKDSPLDHPDTVNGYADVQVQNVAHFPQAGFLNGVATLPHTPNIVLIADSFNGTVGHFNLATNHYDPHAFQFSEMNPVPGSQFPLGVNGIHVRESYLYFSNSDTTSLYRLAITKDGYPARGAKAELVANLSHLDPFIDDFTFDRDGNIWVVTNPGNTLIFVDAKTGEANVVAGEKTSLALASGTAVRFGTGEKDRRVAYVTTAGGLSAPVNGTLTEGGAVVAVETKEMGRH